MNTSNENKKEAAPLYETSDLNEATFLKSVKDFCTAGHRHEGRQLIIMFDISKADARKYREEYLNSPFADYDATKRNFIQLLKR